MHHTHFMHHTRHNQTHTHAKAFADEAERAAKEAALAKKRAKKIAIAVRCGVAIRYGTVGVGRCGWTLRRYEWRVGVGE